MAVKPKPLCYVNLAPAEIKRGHIGYARTTGFLGFLIRVGERLKWRNGDSNHAFIVVDEGDTYETIWIVQATLRGVVKSTLAPLLENSYVVDIYPPAVNAHPELVVIFAENEIGSPYGLMSICCIALDITTPDWFIAFRRKNTWICSALAGESMRFAGWYDDVPDIYCQTPTQLKVAHLKCLP